MCLARGRACVNAIGLAAALVTAGGCRARDPARDAAHADSPVTQPDRFDSIDRLLPQLSAVARGTVSDIAYDYSDCEGPRTVIKLRRVETLLGTNIGREVELRTLGGPLPNGKYVSVSELPRYVKGGSYILFLRNTDWRFSSVMGDLAFREETIAGRKVLVDSDGLGVTGVGKSGIERLTDQLTEAAGVRAAGMTRKPGASENAAGAPASAVAHPIDRFARPAVSVGVGAAQVASAISADELVASIKRLASDHRVQIGGRLQPRSRLGCWNVTRTDPWR
jgi:hypothetical protein